MKFLNLALLVLCLIPMCGGQNETRYIGQEEDSDPIGYLEKECGFTKEYMEEYLKQILQDKSKIVPETYVGSALSSSIGIEYGKKKTQDKTLRSLIKDAKDGSTVHIPSGYYVLDKTLHIDKNLTLIGDGQVVIDAESDHQILNLVKDISVHVENVTFANSKGGNGGAIYTRAHDLALENCKFYNNTAYQGAGLYSDEGDISISNCTIIGNNAILGIVAMPYGGKLILENTEFSENVGAQGANSLFFIGNSRQPSESMKDRSKYRHRPREVFEDYSKGIYSDDLELIINNCSFHDNAATGWGEATSDAIAVGNTLIANSDFRSNSGIKYGSSISTGGNSVVITNTNVTDNVLTVWGPTPGIEIYGGNILIDHCLVSDNHNVENGKAECGGIMVCENASVEIVDSTITNNAGIRGGIYVWPGANLTIRNCNISDNSASKKGGAIFNEGNLTVIGGTIEGNRASIGGSIWNANHMALIDVTLDEVVEPQPWECV
jgi:hypothetical protein